MEGRNWVNGRRVMEERWKRREKKVEEMEEGKWWDGYIAKGFREVP